ncbi:MAG: EAL domain-containing protein [Planctomycetota bacterium]
MPPATSPPSERISRSTTVKDDVFFLSGPTQVGEGVVHTPIDGSPYVVGRKTGVSLKLQFRTVSGNHACLWIERGGLFIRDLGSTNGTYINGRRLDDGESVVVKEEDLIHFAEAPFRVRRQSPTGVTSGTIAENVCDQALALVQFDRLMNERLVRPHFQSIVSLIDGRSNATEILGRGKVFGLESVGAMFQAAEQLNLEVELSQLLRWEGIRVGKDLPDTPTLYVNTHPREIEDLDGLIASLVSLREMTEATDLVLEIHESSVTDIKKLRVLIRALESLRIGLAYDDFGSGQARLAELIEARPLVVKFDISLVHEIDQADAQRRRMLRTLVKMVSDLDILALAEGVETRNEAAVCRDLGFDLAQGYFYGRPSPA